MSRTGVEPARDNSHYPLKVARLPISPPGQLPTNMSRCIMHNAADLFKSLPRRLTAYLLIVAPIARITEQSKGFSMYASMRNKDGFPMLCAQAFQRISPLTPPSVPPNTDLSTSGLNQVQAGSIVVRLETERDHAIKTIGCYVRYLQCTAAVRIPGHQISSQTLYGY